MFKKNTMTVAGVQTEKQVLRQTSITRNKSISLVGVSTSLASTNLVGARVMERNERMKEKKERRRGGGGLKELKCLEGAEKEVSCSLTEHRGVLLSTELNSCSVSFRVWF